MRQVERGFRSKLDAALKVGEPISLELIINGRAVYDFTCFGVDADNKLSDDRYMVFYNQLSSPNREISAQFGSGRADFSLNLTALPYNIVKLVFAASIDGPGNMSEIESCSVRLLQNGQPVLASAFKGSQFVSEKAIIAVEIYKKDVWRINFVGQGFSGGLSDLLRFYGGEEAAGSAPPAAPPPAPAPVPAAGLAVNAAPAAAPTIMLPDSAAGAASSFSAGSAAPTVPLPGSAPIKPKVSLEKKLEKAPALVSLAKHVKVSLEKHNLESCIARVGLVLDSSGSMNASYINGTVQEIVNRILPLAVQFDNDGELDLWFFADRPMRFPSVNLLNYSDVVPGKRKQAQSGGRGGLYDSIFVSYSQESSSGKIGSVKELYSRIGVMNNEAAVMAEVIKEYEGSKLPVYIVFISDGNVNDVKGITDMMVKASTLPIFWQFVGVSGSNYGILEHLDTMRGRFIDNASFFALDDFMTVDKTELYNRLLAAFPGWLREARAKGIIK